MFGMRRRDFVALLGGAAVAWPLATRAQQGERMRRIGVLMGTSADEPESQIRLAAFLQGLQEAGWAVGRNARIEYRWAAGDRARLRPYAEELVALGSDCLGRRRRDVPGPATSEPHSADRFRPGHRPGRRPALLRVWPGRAATLPDLPRELSRSMLK